MLDESSEVKAFALQRSFAEVLGSFAALDEVFVMTRNESCVLATVASPLRYGVAGRRSVAWSEDLTMQLSARKSPEVVAYHEVGGEAEFFDDRGRGFLKVYPTNGVPSSLWNHTISRMATGVYPLESLPFLRKTNHLGGNDTSATNTLSAQPPTSLRSTLDTFFQRVIEGGLLIDVRVPCGMLCADLAFAPADFDWKGPWLFAASPASGCHIRVEKGCSVHPSSKAGGLQLLDIFDAGGGFVARLTSRPNHKNQP